MSSRRLTLAVVLTAAVVVPSACTGDEPPEPPRPPSYADPTVAVQEAAQTYGRLVRDVADEVAGIAGTTARRAGPETVWRSADLDSCVYASARYELDAVLGDEVEWAEVREATADVVEAHGFEVTEQLDIPGGFNGFDAVADDGGRFEVRSKSGTPSTIDLEAPVVGDCPANGSETLSP